MPREYVHWAVLEKAVAELKTRDAPRVYQCLKNNLSEALIGAVLPDAPYYYKLGADSFAHTAEGIHGANGEDTFDPIRKMSRYIVANKNGKFRQALWATVFGVISHCITDIVFHPMVYYFTGDYYHPDSEKRGLAQTRHRLFEVHLDAWFKASGAFVDGRTLKEMLGESLASFPAILQMTAECMTGASVESGEKKWKEGFLTMSRCTKLFDNDVLGILVRVINRVCFDKFASVNALCHFGRRTAHPFFNSPLSYLNPVTGGEYKKDIQAMFNEATEECVLLFVLFEQLLKSHDVDEVAQVLGSIKGRSLNFGVIGVTSRDARHYAESIFPF